MIRQLVTVSEQQLSQATILIVDDQAMNVELVQSILGNRHNYIFASSGEEAIEQAFNESPDLILLDVAMGGISGIDVCKYLKTNEATSEIPVVFMTSLESMTDEEKCWEAGAVDFISKPISSLTLINRIRVHLKLKFQSDAMQRLAFVDGLTGVYNRRYIDNQLAIGLKQRRRQGTDYSLLMVDVDHFKDYNDDQGHLEGDDCLKRIARILVDVVSRPLDVVGRFGGEEFIVLLPDTGEDGAIQIGKRMIKAIYDEGIDHAGSSYGKVTVSIGAVTVDGDGPNTPAELIKVADQALYDAKKEGRNRLKAAGVLTPN